MYRTDVAVGAEVTYGGYGLGTEEYYDAWLPPRLDHETAQRAAQEMGPLATQVVEVQ